MTLTRFQQMWNVGGIIRRLLYVLAVCNSCSGLCELPERWRGGWFQSGVREVISLTRSEFSTKGVCVDSSGEKFLFKERDQGCYRCVAISEKHENVLQYKETLCEPIKSLEELCSQIAGDALLFSIFRRDSLPIPCPFKGPLTFSYSQGQGQCRTPISTIDSCTSESRLLFKYQACPDVHNTESSEEEVECVGKWKEGSTRYFVGKRTTRRAVTDEDRYRCFAWERATDPDGDVDYVMAQSGDATCNGVFSAYDGSRTLKISKAGSYNGCEFPNWVSANHRWHSLDRGISYSVAHKNTTLRLHYSHSQIQASVDPGSPSSVVSQTRLVCSQVRESNPATATLVAHFTQECKSGYVCTDFYRRDANVIEIQQGSPAIRVGDACLPSHFNSSVAVHTTLTTATPQKRPCPLMGIWVSSDKECGSPSSREVAQMRAGCGSPDHSLEFFNGCGQSRTDHAYTCHGHWQEGRLLYAIVSLQHHPSNRRCLIASVVSSPIVRDDEDADNRTTSFIHPVANRTLSVSAHAHSCPRHVVPPTTTLSLNLTALGGCLVSSGSSMTVASRSNLIPSLVILALLSSILRLRLEFHSR